MPAMSEITHAHHPPAHEPGGGPVLDGGGHEQEDQDAHGGHGAHGPALGPVDWFAWGAGILGVGAGAVVAVCLYVATSL